MKTRRSELFRFIICMAVVFAAAVLASPAFGTPIRYTAQFTVGDFPPDPSLFPSLTPYDPLGLTGSQFTLEYEWDAASLLPIDDYSGFGADRRTVWPMTNTTFELTIRGSTAADGMYVGNGGGAWLSFSWIIIRGRGRGAFLTTRSSFRPYRLGCLWDTP